MAKILERLEASVKGLILKAHRFELEIAVHYKPLRFD